MSTSYLKPSTRGMRQPLENGSVSDMIVQPARFAQIGGLKSPSKIGKKNTMAIRKPGQSEHK